MKKTKRIVRKQTIRKANGRTTCCNAYTTFVEDVECCKACYEAVVNEQLGVTVRIR